MLWVWGFVGLSVFLFLHFRCTRVLETCGKFQKMNRPGKTVILESCFSITLHSVVRDTNISSLFLYCC